MNITTIGIDLAKSVFQVHGVDERGYCVVQKRLKRKQVLVFFAQLSPCRIGMEACAGSHYWARALQKLGHTVKLHYLGMAVFASSLKLPYFTMRVMTPKSRW